MKQFISEYRFVKIVKENSEVIEGARKPESKLSGFTVAEIVTLSAKKDFIDKYSDTSMQQAGYICADAIFDGYINGRTIHLNGEKVDTIYVTKKGRKLLDTPLGTLQCLLDELGSVFTWLIATAALAVSIFALFKS